jgi:hypothetical protein
MSRFQFIVATWILSGFIAFVIDHIRIKKTNETPFPFLRCLFWGYIGLFFEIILATWPPCDPENSTNTRIP